MSESLEPFRYECFGKYGWGNGWLSPEQHEHAAERNTSQILAFCGPMCKQSEECAAFSRKQYARENPGDVARWDQIKAAAGEDQGLLQSLQEENPYYHMMLRNMQDGTDARLAQIDVEA